MRLTSYAVSLIPLVFGYACSSSSNGDLGDDDVTQPGSDASTGADSTLASDGSSPTSDSGSDASIQFLPDGGRDFGNDTSTFYGASRCSTAGVLLCDGFETGTLDTSTWSVTGQAPTIDGVHTARGSKALHIARTGNGASYIKEGKTFPVADDTYFGRVFVWFEKLPVQYTDGGFSYAHWTFIAGTGTGAQGEIRVSAQYSALKNIFGLGTDTGTEDGGSGDWTNRDTDPGPAGTPTPVPTGQWLCIEWEHAGKTNETHFFWNGTEHPSMATTATHNGGNGNPFILPEFTDVWIGWNEYQANDEPFEMWVDEVAIDTSRIGCVL